jgi:hypothetical protein
MATPQGALAQLRNEPDYFLANYYVITERAMHQSGPTPYYFGALGYVALNGTVVYDRTPRKGRYLGSLRMHNSKNFKFARSGTSVVGNTVNLMAWHVDVVGSATVPVGAIPSLAVSRGGGPNIVLTTLLNGCSFVCEARVHDVLMAHVQPTGGTSAAQLETNITNNGALVGGAGAGAVTVFGGGVSYTAANSDVTIIGVRQGVAWELYAQIHPRNQRTIANVVQFFNG